MHFHKMLLRTVRPLGIDTTMLVAIDAIEKRLSCLAGRHMAKKRRERYSPWRRVYFGD